LTDDGQVADIKTIHRGVSGGVHQIDFIGERLYVVDAYRNELLILGPRRWWGWVKQLRFPRGTLSNGRDSPNYAQFNSVYADQQHLFLLAHNMSWRTQRPSQVLIFERDSWREVGVIENVGWCAHNILIHDGLFLICDSLSNGQPKGVLRNHNMPVFHADKMVRGLALNDDLLLVGGSEISERSQRYGTDVWVYCLDRQLNYLDKAWIPSAGQIHEIRFIGKDYGLSNVHLEGG
jgi:hypothetical protein